MKNQTVLIGLDGATFDVLDPLMQEGVMPFLAKFMARGVRATLTSIIPPLTPPAWTSLATGRRPGHHGIFDFFLREPDGPHIRFASSKDVHTETIWSMASRHGHRVTALNFPVMFPPPEIAGNVVAGWIPWRQLRYGCYPDDLYDRLKALPDFNVRELALDMADEEKALEGCPPEEYEAWIDLHIRRERHWCSVLEYLSEVDPCPLTAVLFDGVDKIQHLCWRFLMPDRRNGKPSVWEHRIRDRCLEYFANLDRMLERIDGIMGPEATTVIASDHGFGPQIDTFFVNAWLEQNGYLAWSDENVPHEGVNGQLGMGQLARHVFTLDWDKTRAYASTPSSNGIHIVSADDTDGLGVPSDEYLAFRQHLMDALYDIKSPTTGDAMISRIWTREEVFEGPRGGQSPDLTLSLWDGGIMSILASDVVAKTRPEPTGSHRPEGMFLAKGPGIRRDAEVPALSLLDVAPLLLYSWGVPVCPEMEGRLPESIFESATLEQNPVRVAETVAAVTHSKPAKDRKNVFDAEAEAKLAAHLRALGYIE